MIKISRLADYAVIVLSAMSPRESELLSAAAIAQKAALPEPTTAKVLKLLSKANLINATRGASGGYALGKSADDISIAEIIAAVDGPIALTSCIDGDQSCCYESFCGAKTGWHKVNAAIKTALEEVSLRDMVQTNYKPLQASNHERNIARDHPAS